MSSASETFLRKVKAALWDQDRARSAGNVDKFPGVYWLAPNGRVCGVGCSLLSNYSSTFRIVLIHCARTHRFSEWTATLSELSGLAPKALESAENHAGLHRHSPGALLRRKVQFVWEEASDDDESHCGYYVTRKAAQCLGFPIVKSPIVTTLRASSSRTETRKIAKV